MSVTPGAKSLPSREEGLVQRLVRLVVVFVTLAGLLGVVGARARAADETGVVTRAVGALHASRDCDPDSWMGGRVRAADVRALETPSRPTLDRQGDGRTRQAFGAPHGALSRAFARRLGNDSSPHSPAPRSLATAHALASPGRARAILMVFHI